MLAQQADETRQGGNAPCLFKNAKRFIHSDTIKRYQATTISLRGSRLEDNPANAISGVETVLRKD